VAARTTNTGAAGIHTGHGCEPELADRSVCERPSSAAASVCQASAAQLRREGNRARRRAPPARPCHRRPVGAPRP
jgi:hypothetical protein